MMSRLNVPCTRLVNWVWLVGALVTGSAVLAAGHPATASDMFADVLPPQSLSSSSESAFSRFEQPQGASYIYEDALIKEDPPIVGNRFGFSVAVSDNTMVVGSPYYASSSGVARVFVRQGESWTQVATLRAHNPDANDIFGMAVAISGDTIVVGAPSENGAGSGIDPEDNNDGALVGAAYVFFRSGGNNWQQQAYLKPPVDQFPAGTSRDFGRAVAISGNTVVVGAPNSSVRSAYVFVRNGSTWSQQARLQAHTSGSDHFGFAVGISGDTVVVGAFGEDGGGVGVNPDAGGNPVTNSGAAYVFARTGGIWNQQAYLRKV